MANLTTENLAEVLNWEHPPVTDTSSGGEPLLEGTLLAPVMLPNGFGLILRTNPDMDARFPDSSTIYTAFVAGCNEKGRAEVLAGYNAYEYITPEAVLLILAELSDLDFLDPVEESDIFLRPKPPRPWYDLAGKISDYLTGVVAGTNRFIDKITDNNDKDEW